MNIPKLANGGIISNKLFIAAEKENSFALISKVITKKRFIKLLMSKGFQRNDATKIHKEYMQKYKHRTRIGLEMYFISKDIFNKLNQNIKIYIGNKEIIYRR